MQSWPVTMAMMMAMKMKIVRPHWAAADDDNDDDDDYETVAAMPWPGQKRCLGQG